MEPEGVIDSNWDEVCENFDDMELREELLRGIYAYGFEKPSAIQQRAIVPCVKGYDVIAQAQSGTGKTATFSISILQKVTFYINKIPHPKLSSRCLCRNAVAVHAMSFKN